MSKRGSGSAGAGKFSGWDKGRATIQNINVQGTEKQIKYAKDILARPFEFVEANVNRYEELATKARTDIGKRDYKAMANEVKEFGAYLNNDVYKAMAESGHQLKASFVIENSSRYDGNYLFNDWKRRNKKK